MGENYDCLSHKEVYDFLSSVDLEKARKQSVKNHYKNDWKDIIKRKISMKN